MIVRQRSIERYVALSIIALALFMGWGALQMPMGTLSLPGPGVLPLALAGLLLVVGLVLFVQNAPSRADQDAEVRFGHRDVFVGAAALCAYALVFETAGYLVTSALFLFVLLWRWSPLGPWRAAVAAVLGAVVSQLFFGRLLGVVLPQLPVRLF